MHDDVFFESVPKGLVSASFYRMEGNGFWTFPPSLELTLQSIPSKINFQKYLQQPKLDAGSRIFLKVFRRDLCPHLFIWWREIVAEPSLQVWS